MLVELDEADIAACELSIKHEIGKRKPTAREQVLLAKLRTPVPIGVALAKLSAWLKENPWAHTVVIAAAFPNGYVAQLAESGVSQKKADEFTLHDVLIALSREVESD